MIARILYRENVHGVLNYVLGKSNSIVLGFQNTYSDTDTDKEFFKGVLYYLGNRHDSEKRYVHISINLPRGERLSDKDFFELSKEYMDHMGYGEQPYVVIRHRDTKHEHIHIVSTTIREDCQQINLSNDFRRNIATQKHLEKRYGLTPSPKDQGNKGAPDLSDPPVQERGYQRGQVLYPGHTEQHPAEVQRKKLRGTGEIGQGPSYPSKNGQ